MAKKHSYGFTLIEMLLSVSIIAALSTISLPVYQSFQGRNDLSIAAQRTADTFRRAQTYARGSYYDSTWGVYIQAGSVTLYKGSTYASRDSSYDESFVIPGGVTISTSSDVSLARLTGFPTAAVSINMTSTTGSIRTVSMNTEGMVTY